MSMKDCEMVDIQSEIIIFLLEKCIKTQIFFLNPKIGTYVVLWLQQ